MHIPMRVLLGEWRPTERLPTGHLPGDGIMPHLKETYYSTRIRPGSLIVFSDRRAWQIIDVSERPDDLWPEHFNNEWDRFTTWWTEQAAAGRDMGAEPTRATWEHRPLVLILRPADQPTAKPRHIAIRASRTFFVLPEHYSLCRLCQEIPPCRHVVNEATIEREMASAERLMAIPAGACLGCTEPITSRMKAVRFPGPNLWRPDLGPDTAVFHARQDCEDSVRSYRQLWEEKGHAELQPELPEEAP
ncbi:hypothetical protein ACFQ0X_43860 [Streptomyces rectiviolaceus]|uniref:Uncharacterized protein n=1 Tax=Streptomyces rectiviolaceus TaxID=332591 RepID=A0ABP6NMM8_9ACTN